MIYEIRAELLEKIIEKQKEYIEFLYIRHRKFLQGDLTTAIEFDNKLVALEQEQEEQSKGIGRLMSNPKECGYRSRNPYLIDDTFSCLNPKDKNTVCNDTEKFPDNCPLQAYRTEGIRKEYHDESAEFLSDI
jgi:hypothetical protein